jgi:glutathione S-transferase
VITVWGRTNSSNVMKVLWLLDELGLDYRRIDAGREFGRTATPEYRAMSPLGLVPALQDDGFSMFESNAILRYLCRAYAPETALYPREARARATVEAWMEFQQTALTPPQSAVYTIAVRTPPEQRDETALARSTVTASAVWGVLDARLERYPYLAGETFSLADMTIGPVVHRWLNMEIGRPDAQHLRAWYQRLLQRPAYVRHCAVALT